MSDDASLRERLQRRHLRLGWWGLVVFVALGLALESFHGFKAGFYLDVDVETRRLVWRLAHAHGTLLSLLQLAFAWSAGRDGLLAERPLAFASRALTAALVLLPLGFFLGGIVVHGGDPWIGILLVPAGGLCLLAGVAATAWSSLAGR